MEDKNEPAVSAAVSKVRALLTPHGVINTRLLDESLERRALLCACLDIIEDCDWAIHRYQQGPSTTDLGFLYLMTYGLLQALFVQQDAVKYAAEAVRMPYSRPAELVEIRQVRNSAIGHAPEKSAGYCSGGFELRPLHPLFV